MLTFDSSALIVILPELTLAIIAMILLIVGAFRGDKYASDQIRLSIGALFFVLILLTNIPQQTDRSIFTEMIVANSFVHYTKILLTLAAALPLVLSLGYYRDHKRHRICEFPVLVLLSVVGMMIMVSANNLIVLYVGLELQSLSLYVLAAMHRDNLKSSEAGLKYFILGSVASGIMLYGCSLIYGFSGTINFTSLSYLYSGAEVVPIGTTIGMVLVLVGLSFKISAVPFHMWTPDVYEGSATPITAFFAVAPKVAAIALLGRFIYEPFGGLADQWQQVIIFLAAASMVIGALGALRQTNIKRLIAYSSIGHVGYILVGLASASPNGLKAMLIYLSIYIAMSVGIFACIMMIRHKDGLSEDISSLSGLAKTQPFMALGIAILLLSMAGIPPFAGFFGKFFIFHAAIQQGLIVLSVIGVLSSVVAAFYYLRIIKIMYFDEASVPLNKELQPELKLIATVASVFNLLFFISFTPLVNSAQNAAVSLF